MPVSFNDIHNAGITAYQQQINSNVSIPEGIEGPLAALAALRILEAQGVHVSEEAKNLQALLFAKASSIKVGSFVIREITSTYLSAVDQALKKSNVKVVSTGKKPIVLA